MSIIDNSSLVLSAATDLLRFFLSVAGGDGERRRLYVFFSRFLSASHIAINYKHKCKQQYNNHAISKNHLF